MRSTASRIASFCVGGTFSTSTLASWVDFVRMTNFCPSHVNVTVSRIDFSPSWVNVSPPIVEFMTKARRLDIACSFEV